MHHPISISVLYLTWHALVKIDICLDVLIFPCLFPSWKFQLLPSFLGDCTFWANKGVAELGHVELDWRVIYEWQTKPWENSTLTEGFACFLNKWIVLIYSQESTTIYTILSKSKPQSNPGCPPSLTSFLPWCRSPGSGHFLRADGKRKSDWRD